MKYQLKKTELLKGCAFLAFRRLKRKKIIKILLLIILLFVLLTSVRYGSVLSVLEYVLPLLFILIFYGGILILLLYRNAERSGWLGPAELSVEHGMVKQRTLRFCEWPVREITVTAEWGGLLFLGRVVLEQEQFLMLPVRVFSGDAQKEQFLGQFRAASAGSFSGGAAGNQWEDSDAGLSEDAPLYEVSCTVDSELLAEDMSSLAHWKWAQRQNFRMRCLLLILCGVIVLTGGSGEKLLIGILIRTLLFAGAVYYLFLYEGSSRQYLRAVERSRAYQTLLGPWTVRFYENRIYLRQNQTESVYGWTCLYETVEFDRLLLFCTEKHGQIFFLPKSALPDEMRKEFLSFCETKSIYTKYQGSSVKRTQIPSFLKGMLLFLAAAAAAALLLGQKYLPGYLENLVWVSEHPDNGGYWPPEPETYVSLDTQVEVLRELGLEIPEELTDALREQMESYEYGSLYTEGYPYVSLLSALGMPKRDTGTWEITEYSDQAYWFDFEGWDISTDYLEILKGVQAISGGEIVFTEMEENTDDVDWEKGTGTIQVSFLLNGRPCEYIARMEYDWIDPGFLTYLMKELAGMKTGKKLYACSDHGQGCILFYREEAWAEEFVKRTGMLMETEG